MNMTIRTIILGITMVVAGNGYCIDLPEKVEKINLSRSFAVAMSISKNLELRVEAAPGLPPIACDRGRILQVIGNLASNAVKATERGEVRLAADPGDGEVVFSVADTGPGIPEAEQAAMFDRFRRGAGARYRGAGLGLSIARALVETHGGRIWIDSRPGAGTVMRFTLPAEGAARAATNVPQGPAGTSTGTAVAGR